MFTFFGHPRYAIFDCQQSPKTPSFYIESISCRFCCTPFLCTCVCGNKEFRIVCVETKEEVGTISRHWQSDHPQPQIDPGSDGVEPFSIGSNQLFGVQFAPNLEARQKVLLLSACFMMDFFYFENDRRRRKLASCWCKKSNFYSYNTRAGDHGTTANYGLTLHRDHSQIMTRDGDIESRNHDLDATHHN